MTTNLPKQPEAAPGLPERIFAKACDGYTYILGLDENEIAIVYNTHASEGESLEPWMEKRRLVCAEIVHRYNQHEGLIEALRACERVFDQMDKVQCWDMGPPAYGTAHDTVTEALESIK